ncbi:MAG: hypothetical protein DRI79_00460, partial [Chloroflexi bacterium]
MPINIFDRVLKILARNYAARFLQLAFPTTEVYLAGTLENVELALPEQRVDFVHRVVHAGQEYLLHMEFQIEHRAEVPRRMFVYSALLTQQFDLPVITLVLYLQRQAASIPGTYEVRVGSELVNSFTYRTLRLWEYEGAIRRGQYPELAPLLVMLVERPDREILTRERELILAEEDPQKRADLLACAVTIGARYFDKEFLWRFFREEVEMLKGASFIEDWLEEKLEEGLQQGLQQGSLEARRQDILHILRTRFDLSEEKATRALMERLQEIEDQALLQGLVMEAVQAESLEAFWA